MHRQLWSPQGLCTPTMPWLTAHTPELPVHTMLAHITPAAGGRGDWGLRRLAASAAAGGAGGVAPGGGGAPGAQQVPSHVRAMLVKALKITGTVALTAGVTGLLESRSHHCAPPRHTQLV